MIKRVRIRVINPILTVLDLAQALPSVGLVLQSAGLYFPVLPSKTVSIGLIYIRWAGQSYYLFFSAKEDDP